MMLQFEAFRYKFVEPTGASVNIKEAITGLAVEVVMVFRRHRCQFVTITAAWDLNFGNFVGFLKFSYKTVDRA